MHLAYPPRLALANTPTPLERLARTSERLGIDLFVKRDDLTGAALSGNKVRKLEYLAAAAREARADTLVTCGAVNSNHARATAVVAARLGMRSHLLLRGENRSPPDGNLLLDRLLGAGTTFIPLEAWPERNARMEEIGADLARRGRAAYVIPEGGSNALGALGYARAFTEILGQTDANGRRLRRIVHAAGSGGTTAGLALGAAALGRDDVEIVGVAVCDDRAWFDQRVTHILDEAVSRGFTDTAVRARCRWTILEGHKGRGYGLTTTDEIRGLARLARTEGLILDPVYTNKAFGGLEALARSEAWDGREATVFLHTGGIFGLFAHAASIEQIAGDDLFS